ncbi:DUF2249 domain-containing protein [Ottowia sp.]|uniref:DUF2249 domain-containing protein n=1 Tax=Ottowia sp. TaxID=1898956 RepID=UPI002BBA4CC8|nr:DUF2249 domain-containing protein [Ottowia sp.]HRN74724.1 DUF2249 domain-containing protein [Ottowia sp.]HRQ01554.1 DUF2249 domain-containing protein [Ottowia sp.]
MMPTSSACRIDVRTIEPAQRHATIFSRFDELAPEQWMELVNDHDPAPLHQQFEAQRPGIFEWAYLERGPQRWRVQIRRVAALAAVAEDNDSCCSGGACC